MFGKNVSDLQSNVEIGSDSISGTLSYIDDYTGFSSDTDLQYGNYIAIHAESNVPDATITVKVTNPVELDEDGIAVLRIADKNSQTITVVASADGYDSITKEYSLTDLVCEQG